MLDGKAGQPEDPSASEVLQDMQSDAHTCLAPRLFAMKFELIRCCMSTADGPLMVIMEFVNGCPL